MSRIQFMAYRDFFPSIQALMAKGGQWQRAAKTVLSAFGLANASVDISVEKVFKGIPLTNHGESRIPSCRKYDLTGHARLVTVYNNGFCIFLFTGNHEETDYWLNKHSGLDFIARESNGTQKISPVFVSEPEMRQGGLVHSDTDWLLSEPVLKLLKDKHRDRIMSGLSDDIIEQLSAVKSYTDEDELIALVNQIPDKTQAEVILDVLLALRSGNSATAVSRVDLYTSDAKRVSELTAEEIRTVVSSETTVRSQDVDPVLLEHFMKTANFKEWMLYLHPAQREIVGRDFAGTARLAGVSGSGKTSVIIHRALRLARENPHKRVLIITLNDALARLILELISQDIGSGGQLGNLKVTSVFYMCIEKLLMLEPDMKNHYVRKTVVQHQFAESEHIDDIWEEYFKCQNANNDADILFDVVRTLIVRGVYPQEYLRQELNYIRSAFAAGERRQYLDMERLGRAFPLDKRYRDQILRSLTGWEKKMSAVGAIDELGIVDALYKHLAKLAPEYDFVLVDEIQDLGTLELKIIRALTKPGENDLFLAGDTAQAVHTKYADLRAANIELPSARWIRLTQNYRNSRQILAAAYSVLKINSSDLQTGIGDMEILSPEYANFSSAKPLLLSAQSPQEELALALGYIKTAESAAGDRKACIAVCGLSQKFVEELGHSLQIEVLSDSTDLSGGKLFLSDLEQTKGFEFDLMVVINCSETVIPNPQLPERESFRELCKLYVALTRAKRELVVSYSRSYSTFLKGSEDHFSIGPWQEHEVVPAVIAEAKWPKGHSPAGNPDEWCVKGRDFLRLRDAVGLSTSAQDAVLNCVTGRPLERRIAGRNRQLEWTEFKGFYDALSSNPRARVNVISNEAWEELNKKYGLVKPTPPQASLVLEKEVAVLPPSTNVEPPRAAEDTALELHRHDGIKGYKKQAMSSHVLATLLVLQRKASIAELEVGVPMPVAALEYLVPHSVVVHWLQNAWLRTTRGNASRLSLTKKGLDECIGRLQKEAPEDPKSEKVTQKAVEAFRQTILHGPSRFDFSRFESRVFGGPIPATRTLPSSTATRVASKPSPGALRRRR